MIVKNSRHIGSHGLGCHADQAHLRLHYICSQPVMPVMDFLPPVPLLFLELGPHILLTAIVSDVRACVWYNAPLQYSKYSTRLVHVNLFLLWWTELLDSAQVFFSKISSRFPDLPAASCCRFSKINMPECFRLLEQGSRQLHDEKLCSVCRLAGRTKPFEDA